MLIANVVNSVTTGKRHAGGPQRVVGRGNKHLIAVLDQRVHGKLDELGHAIARIDVLHVHIGDIAQLRILHDGLARREQAARVGIALAVRQLLAHVKDHLVGRTETKGRRVTDIELEDARTVVFHAGGLVDHGSADIVQNVVELARFLKRTHGCSPGCV